MTVTAIPESGMLFFLLGENIILHSKETNETFHIISFRSGINKKRALFS